MIGIVNQTGARSGVVGTTVSQQAMTLLHNSNVNESGNAANKTFAAAARGVGPGTTGSGYLFQTDFFYYKVFTTGYGFSNGYAAFRLVSTSNSVHTGTYYKHAMKVQDSGGTDWDHNNSSDSMFNLSQRFDHADPYGAAGTTTATAGASHLEITFYNPAGPNRTLVQWAYTQALDADSDLRTVYGSGHYTDQAAHGGFNVLSQNDGTFDGMVQCSVYGMASTTI